MFLPLFANLAVTAIVLVAWVSLSGFVIALSPLRRRLLFGLVMGIATVGSMMMSFQAAPGIHYDMRAPLIAITGFFGGPPAAVVVALAALAYRLTLGGAVAIGAANIALALSIGLAFHLWRRSRDASYADVGAVAAAVALASALFVFTFPAETRAVLLPLVWQPISITFLATLMLGVLLLQDERQRVQAETTRYYRSMVDALPDCLNIKDLEGRFLAANPATAKLMRASSAAELIGRTDFDFYPPDLAKRFREDELAVLRQGGHATIEQPGLLPDGASGWLSTLKAPLLDRDGHTVGLITHNRDVTQRIAVEARLKQTQAQLDQALESMSDGLAIYDSQGVVVLSNRRYRELFPRTAHLRVPGGRFEDIVRASIETGEGRLPPGLSLETFLAEKRAALGRDGETLIEFVDGKVLSAQTRIMPDGSTLRVVSDVTERLMFEKDLEHRALHDPLTGLPNRAFFSRELDRLIAKAGEENGEVVVMLLDLDRFKQVNDKFGHAVGDALLVEVARRLEGSVRRGDVAARLGGDEFAIIAYGPKSGIGDENLPKRILKALAKPMAVDQVTLLPGGTIGYALLSHDRSGPEALLKNADRALYRAKAQGRGTYKAFDPADFDRRAALAG